MNNENKDYTKYLQSFEILYNTASVSKPEENRVKNRLIRVYKVFPLEAVYLHTYNSILEKNNSMLKEIRKDLKDLITHKN